MSQQERVSWIALIVNAVIGYWYFERVFSLPAGADLFGPGMAAFAVQLIVLSIVITVACEVALRIVQKGADGAPDKNRIDERDTLIHLRSGRNAYGVLTICVIIVLLRVAVVEWLQRSGRPGPDPHTMLELLLAGPLAPMHVAQWLLMALALGATSAYASRIFYYRRGY
jgi:hypothetical protein